MVVSDSIKLKAYTDLFVHWDSTYWYAFYVFLVLHGALIVAFTQVYTSDFVSTEIGRKIILFVVSLSGTLFSFIWMFVLNRKFTYTLSAQKNTHDIIPDVIDYARTLQNKTLTRRSSANITKTYMPIGFGIVWLIPTFFYFKLLICLI